MQSYGTADGRSSFVPANRSSLKYDRFDEYLNIYSIFMITRESLKYHLIKAVETLTIEITS
jgi:hypothetical protein